MVVTLARRRLGRTEHESSVAVLGCAAFGDASRDKAEAAITMAVARGVNHIDIAPSYGHAEVVAGPMIGELGDRLFVGEKTNRSSPDGVRAQLNTTLERLGRTRVDLYQAHGVTDLAELDRRSDAIETMLAARDEGLTRFVGITGHDHGTPAAQLAALQRFDLDTVMFPLYPGVMSDTSYAAAVMALLDECGRRDVGVMVIKAVARQPWGSQDKDYETWYQPWDEPQRISDGVRLALSTNGVHAFCTPGDMSLLTMALDAAAAFEPLSTDEMGSIIDGAASWPTIFPLVEHARMG